ncbi:hypothetical protein EHJ15_08425 [Cronobacter muytjensii]|nr:hypothetical protein [Cronobacter muytjensii]
MLVAAILTQEITRLLCEKTRLILLQNVARIVFLHFFSALIFFFYVYTSLNTSAHCVLRLL